MSEVIHILYGYQPFLDNIFYDKDLCYSIKSSAVEYVIMSEDPYFVEMIRTFTTATENITSML